MWSSRKKSLILDRELVCSAINSKQPPPFPGSNITIHPSIEFGRFDPHALPLRKPKLDHFAKKFRNDIDKRPFFHVKRPFIFCWFFLEITYCQNTFGLAVH